MTHPLSLTEDLDGYVWAYWRGERIGRFEYVSGGIVSGSAEFLGAHYDTDNASLDGVPRHWLGPGLAAMCERAERERRAA